MFLIFLLKKVFVPRKFAKHLQLTVELDFLDIALPKRGRDFQPFIDYRF